MKKEIAELNRRDFAKRLAISGIGKERIEKVMQAECFLLQKELFCKELHLKRKRESDRKRRAMLTPEQREEINRKQRERYRKNKGVPKSQTKEEFREKRRLINKRYRERNNTEIDKEIRRIKSREWRIANPDKLKAKNDRFKEKKRLYYLENRDKILRKAKKRRSDDKKTKPEATYPIQIQRDLENIKQAVEKKRKRNSLSTMIRDVSKYYNNQKQ